MFNRTYDIEVTYRVRVSENEIGSVRMQLEKTRQELQSQGYAVEAITCLSDPH